MEGMKQNLSLTELHLDSVEGVPNSYQFIEASYGYLVVLEKIVIHLKSASNRLQHPTEPFLFSAPLSQVSPEVLHFIQQHYPHALQAVCLCQKGNFTPQELETIFPILGQTCKEL